MFLGNYFKNINSKFKNHKFSGLSFKSSECKKNYIFFAIKGSTYDGNKFIIDAIRNGAKTIVSDSKYQGYKNNVLFIKSTNVRKTIAYVSSKIYKNIPKNLIAVTGTNGKSSIANFYLQILKYNKKNVASIGTLGIVTSSKTTELSNTTIDPLKLGKSLEKLKKRNIENVILEASSHGLKQCRLDGLKFKIGIFTNLSHDHLDYHKSYKDYLNSKLLLFRNLLRKDSNIITDKDISEYEIIKSISKKKLLNLNTISNKKGDLSIISHKYIGEKQSLKINYKNKIYKFEINLIGKIQLKNVLMSMIAAYKSNINFQKIINITKKINSVPGRFEKIGSLKNNSFVVLDYAHTPDALKICLKNIKDQFKNRKISIVFGCGGDRDKFKRPLMGKIANDYCDKIYLTDDNPRNENPNKIRHSIKKKIYDSKLYNISDREDAIKQAIENLSAGEVLVVAGKGHETTQDYGSYKKNFSDKNCILKYIKKKNKILNNDLKFNIIKETSNNESLSLKSKIRKASINSKEIKKNDVFFAIRGKNKDGNKFVDEALKKGACLAIVNRLDKSQHKTKQLKVKNTLDFLTKTSQIIRQNSFSKIIAITGSCGKTSLKELLKETLNKFGKASYSPKSFNNKFGVPLSLFNLNLSDDYGVFEVGMDKKGEIDSLSKIIKPDIGIITNISFAHVRNFKNIRQIAMAKAEIINNINSGGSIILNADDHFFNLHKKIAQRKKLKIISFSMNKKTDIHLKSIKKEKQKFKISIIINNKNKIFYTYNNFTNFIKNLLGVVSIISVFKDPTKLNENIFLNFKTPIGRGDISKIKINRKIINLVDESYNSNPLSLKSAIENFDSIKTNKKKHIVIGDMLELGNHSDSLHRKITPILNSSKIHKINILGNKIKETFKNISPSKKGLILKESSEIIDLIKNKLNNNDYLMIKGSNSTGLNKFTNQLKKNNNAI